MADPSPTEIPGQQISTSNLNDLASSDDYLGFAPYVTAISDFLTNKGTQPPLVLSVEGEWGSGKSSFMLQLQKSIEKNKEEEWGKSLSALIINLYKALGLEAKNIEEREKKVFSSVSKLQKVLRVKNRPFIIWFNPWRHDKEEAVWAAFALQFIHGIKKQLWFWQRWKGNILLSMRRFHWEKGLFDLLRKIVLWLLVLGITVAIGITAYVNQGVWNEELNGLVKTLSDIKELQDVISKGIQAGGITAYIAFLLFIFSKIETVIGDPLKIDLKKYIEAPNYEERVSFVENFHRDFKRIVEAYTGKQIVYVFIDDVDRCEVPKAADLMSALNLMISNDVKIIFIIGMDREKVAAGLAVKHEKLIPYLFAYRATEESTLNDKLAGLEYGYNFIEKFVQFPFLLPRPNETALADFLQRLSGSRQEESLWQIWRKNLGTAAKSVRERIDTFNQQFRKAGRQKQQNVIEGNTASPSDQPSNMSTKTKVLTPEIQKERDVIKTQVAEDSEYISKIVKIVTLTLENNPALIEQFKYIFRLWVDTALEDGLFDSNAKFPLTLEQLGKFVILKLRWQSLLTGLASEPSLLNHLQSLALAPVPELVSPQPVLERWRQDTNLMEFLRLGCLDAKEQRDPEAEQRWGLENVDISRLLRVAETKLPSEIQKLIRREIVKIYQASADSPKIGEIANMIAPAFENNPRRLKQFVNLLRLRIYIAAQTGLFDYEGKIGEPPPLTLEQLGKFVAINLNWPLLIADLSTHPSLLSSLQKLALAPDAVVPTSAALERWRRRGDLMEFLLLGCRGSEELKNLWSLEPVDTRELLRVSPQVRKVGPLQPTVTETGRITPAREKRVGISIESNLPVSDDANAPAQTTVNKVLVIVYDPIMDKATGRKLSQTLNWNRPEDLATEFLSDILNSSGGMARYQIIQRLDVDEFPAKIDGFRYTPQTYLNVLGGSMTPNATQDADYESIIKRFNVLQRFINNEIDEVWIFSFPHAGFYESVIGGPSGFWCNAPPLKNTEAAGRRFVIMGFSSERGVGEMLEAFGHRAESIMEKTFEGLNGEFNLWNRFTRYEQVAPNHAACGTVHFAPNSQADYDWNNQTEVISECDDWLLNFPDFKGIAKKVNASEWGNGDIRAHHKWWLNHIPKVAGRRNGINNNWWQYIMNPNYVE